MATIARWSPAPASQPLSLRPYSPASPAMSAPVDNTLLELFRTEVELHSETLTAGMLALEQAPADEGTLERLMRASHSIKGAARIVQMTPAAEIAHALEDCFVAAQRKTLLIAPVHIDALLKGVDLLGQCSTATRQANWSPAPFQTLATEFTTRLKQLLHPSASPAAAVAPASSPLPAAGLPPAPAATPAPAHSDAPRGTSPVAQAEPGPGSDSGWPPPAPPARLQAAGLSAMGTAGLDSPPPVTEAAQALAIATVVCPARLDRASAELTRRQLLATLATGPAVVMLDCSATDDFDASGLAFLVAAERHCGELSRTLRLAPVSSTLQELLPLVGLGHLVGDAR